KQPDHSSRVSRRQISTDLYRVPVNMVWRHRLRRSCSEWSLSSVRHAVRFDADMIPPTWREDDPSPVRGGAMNLMQADPSHAQRRVEAALVAAAGRATPQQRAVFEAIADDNAGNLMIKAVAGSGKTTTLEWSAHALNPRHRVLMVAFTRVI